MASTIIQPPRGPNSLTFQFATPQHSTTKPTEPTPELASAINMHSKLLAVLSLCVAASVLQATDAGAAAPAGLSPHRHLGAKQEDYGHHPRHHDHDKYYRRRLEDAKKATESSDYDYGKDNYGKDRKDD
ncbi:hypothetical protein PHYSODRAFT_339295 [Phytophthora sojae]|uniref:Uncharacterized protein n=1 Tax=Phytophthora sojae (strain P6497) TaxID=1094619 RepID=G5A6B7_PHYSP|nr:hypothetical protein PHYSODRAFT_339295 [Phytophthora sojae]EGZ08872.1 hypothetical protein PHYSODRAFT_339295 [Phytophthora sojae]|eukprot:XP_009535505.1 hypothetical protein PHYSODRAFT_339295 [Phytophthora sojae]